VGPKRQRLSVQVPWAYSAFLAIHDQAYSGSNPGQVQIAIVNTMISVRTDSQFTAHNNELQGPIIPNGSVGDYGEEVRCEFGPNSHGT
jgi:hypothetical protein